jgi:hypothetical protein
MLLTVLEQSEVCEREKSVVQRRGWNARSVDDVERIKRAAGHDGNKGKYDEHPRAPPPLYVPFWVIIVDLTCC